MPAAEILKARGFPDVRQDESTFIAKAPEAFASGASLYMPDIPYSRLTAARHSSSESSPAARPGPARPKQSPSAPAPPGDIRHIC